MKTCHTCGNRYDKCFDVTKDGETFSFDSFECAVHSLAPRCEHCQCRILGHGVEAGERIFCCAHCARAHGVDELKDNADAA